MTSNICPIPYKENVLNGRKKKSGKSWNINKEDRLMNPLLRLRPLVLFSSHGSCYLSIKCLCLCSLQYLNLLENCCGMREGSVLILLCDICEYPARSLASMWPLQHFQVCVCERVTDWLRDWVSWQWLVSCSMEEIITLTSIMMSSMTLNHQPLSHHGNGSWSDRGLRQQSDTHAPSQT